MFKRPSTRRNTEKEQIALNLVPMLDAMTTIIIFLLMTMAFMAIVSISSPVPMVSKEQQQKLTEKPLQLTVSIREDSVRIWSPFGRVQARTIPNTPDLQPDIYAIHDHLIGIKQKFPAEEQIVLSPEGLITYDILVAIMDTIQNLEPTDPAIFITDPTTGLDQEAEMLFPKIVFGNLLGG